MCVCVCVSVCVSASVAVCKLHGLELLCVLLMQSSDAPQYTYMVRAIARKRAHCVVYASYCHSPSQLRPPFFAVSVAAVLLLLLLCKNCCFVDDGELCVCSCGPRMASCVLHVTVWV